VHKRIEETFGLVKIFAGIGQTKQQARANPIPSGRKAL